MSVQFTQVPNRTSLAFMSINLALESQIKQLELERGKTAAAFNEAMAEAKDTKAHLQEQLVQESEIRIRAQRVADSLKRQLVEQRQEIQSLRGSLEGFWTALKNEPCLQSRVLSRIKTERARLMGEAEKERLQRGIREEEQKLDAVKEQNRLLSENLQHLNLATGYQQRAAEALKDGLKEKEKRLEDLREQDRFRFKYLELAANYEQLFTAHKKLASDHLQLITDHKQCMAESKQFLSALVRLENSRGHKSDSCFQQKSPLRIDELSTQPEGGQ